MGKGRVKKAQLNAGGNLAMDWHPIPSASVCHYCTFLFQFVIKNEGNQMDTQSNHQCFSLPLLYLSVPILH